MLLVRVFTFCALASVVHSTVFDAVKASKILRARAKAELASKVHAGKRVPRKIALHIHREEALTSRCSLK